MRGFSHGRLLLPRHPLVLRALLPAAAGVNGPAAAPVFLAGPPRRCSVGDPMFGHLLDTSPLRSPSFFFFFCARNGTVQAPSSFSFCHAGYISLLSRLQKRCFCGPSWSVWLKQVFPADARTPHVTPQLVTRSSVVVQLVVACCQRLHSGWWRETEGVDIVPAARADPAPGRGRRSSRDEVGVNSQSRDSADKISLPANLPATCNKKVCLSSDKQLPPP